MAITKRILKPFKWFVCKNLPIRLHGKSGSSNSLSFSHSPLPSCTSSTTIPYKNCINKEEELKEIFRHFDMDGDGKISALELRSYFGSIGEYLSHEEAQGLILELDSDGDNLLDLQDFNKMMMKSDQESDVEDLQKAFEMFVLEKGSDFITPKGLQRMLHHLGDEKSYDECVAMIEAFDIDHNGVLDFNEFHQMMA